MAHCVLAAMAVIQLDVCFPGWHGRSRYKSPAGS